MTKGMKILIAITGVLATACIALGITLFVSTVNHKETTPVVSGQLRVPDESTTTSTTVDTTTSTTAKKTTTSATTTTETTTTVATTTANIYQEANLELFYSPENKPYAVFGCVNIQDPNGTLNVRKYPDPNSEIIGHLEYHQQIKFIKKPINGFYMISIDEIYDNCGYVSADYILEGEWRDLFPEDEAEYLKKIKDYSNNGNSNSYIDTSLNDVVRLYADNPLVIHGKEYPNKDLPMYEISDIRYRIERGPYDGQYVAYVTSYTVTNVGDVEVQGFPGMDERLGVYDSYGNFVTAIILSHEMIDALPLGESRTCTTEKEVGFGGYFVEGDYYIREYW